MHVEDSFGVFVDFLTVNEIIIRCDVMIYGEEGEILVFGLLVIDWYAYGYRNCNWLLGLCLRLLPELLYSLRLNRLASSKKGVVGGG